MSDLEDAHGQMGGVFGVVDPDARHGDAPRHLGGGEQRVEAVQGADRERYADHGEVGERRGDPRPLAPDTSFVVCSGWRWAEETWNSQVTPACVRMSKAGSIRGLSLSEPT